MLHCLQCVTRVEGLSKLEHHTSTAQVIEDRGPPSRWTEGMLQRNLHCSTYNIQRKQGCLEPESSCENASTVVTWSFPDPGKIPWTVPIREPKCIGPMQRFPTQNPQANQERSIRNTPNPSCHRTGRTTVAHPAQPGRVSAKWARPIRQLAPVRGINRPSIPPPFHWCEET